MYSGHRKTGGRRILLGGGVRDMKTSAAGVRQECVINDAGPEAPTISLPTYGEQMVTIRRLHSPSYWAISQIAH